MTTLSSKLASQAVISSIFQAVGTTQQILKESLATQLTFPAESFQSDINNFVSSEMKHCSDGEISDFVKMINHYLAKIKIYLYQIVENITAQVAQEYTTDFTNQVSKKFDDAIEVAFGVAAIGAASLVNPTAGVVVGTVINADGKLSNSKASSYMSQIATSFRESCLWDGQSQAGVVQNATNSARGFLNNRGFVTEETFIDAYGDTTDDEEEVISFAYPTDILMVSDDKVEPMLELATDTFVLIEQEEPMTAQKLCKNLRAGAKEKANSALSDLYTTFTGAFSAFCRPLTEDGVEEDTGHLSLSGDLEYYDV